MFNREAPTMIVVGLNDYTSEQLNNIRKCQDQYDYFGLSGYDPINYTEQFIKCMYGKAHTIVYCLNKLLTIRNSICTD